MGTFAETVATIQGNIQAAIVDSGIFQDLSDKIADFLPTTEEAKTMYEDASKYFTTNIMPGLSSLWDWITGEGMDAMTDGVGGMWNYVKDTLWPKVKEIFTYLTDLWAKLTPKIDAFFAEGGTFDKMMTTFTKLYEEYAPKITEFFSLLFSKDGIKNLYEAFKDKIINAFGDLTEGIGWLALGGFITFKLIKMIAKLNPFVKIASLIVGGLIAVIGWDNLKKAFDEGGFMGAIGTAFKTIWAGITHLFSWESLKGYIGAMLPSGKIGDWARGKLGIGASPEASGTVTTTQKNPTIEEAVSNSASASEMKELTGDLGKTGDAKDANGGEGGWLSNKLDGLIEVMKGNKKATEKLNGNLNGG
jgi:hypothetical protein